MKTDNYLTLCLEQAARSPLHYRHGAIVVRGGKVIGQGYNDYRPGFDGGALKHGRIAKGRLDGLAMAELREKLKKQKVKPKQQQQQQQSAFVQFENMGMGMGMGGGCTANVPLSMHSEMMAIHSALAASSTLSPTAFACEKPCFKLPGGDKRKARLRAEVLKQFKSAVLKLPHLDRVVHHQSNNHNHNHKEDEEERKSALPRHAQQSGVQHLFHECHAAFHAPLSGEKHQKNQKRKEKHQRHQNRGGTIQDRDSYRPYSRYGSQIHGQQQGQASAVSEKQKSNVRCDNDNDVYDALGNDDPKRRYDSTVHGVMTEMSRGACVDAERSSGNGKKDSKRAKHSIVEPPQPEVMLLPKGHTTPSTIDRKKNPRLMGADLYVARLGWCKDNKDANVELPTIPVPTSPPIPAAPTSPDSEILASSTSSIAISSSSTTICSLHDELIDREPSPTHSFGPTTSATQEKLDPSIIRASRPCYRCISYMHSIGIKRVFWTSDAGTWEGGKVRDLVDALENSMGSVINVGGGGGDMDGDKGVMGNGVFVTKHEVLMLKRRMGMKK